MKRFGKYSDFFLMQKQPIFAQTTSCSTLMHSVPMVLHGGVAHRLLVIPVRCINNSVLLLPLGQPCSTCVLFTETCGWCMPFLLLKLARCHILIVHMAVVERDELEPALTMHKAVTEKDTLCSFSYIYKHVIYLFIIYLFTYQQCRPHQACAVQGAQE